MQHGFDFHNYFLPSLNKLDAPTQSVPLNEADSHDICIILNYEKLTNIQDIFSNKNN